jgi:hypothetical protein
VHASDQDDRPMDLTATELSLMAPLPMDWEEERQLLGMA